LDVYSKAIGELAVKRFKMVGHDCLSLQPDYH
jgi:hypothetical protein